MKLLGGSHLTRIFGLLGGTEQAIERRRKVDCSHIYGPMDGQSVALATMEKSRAGSQSIVARP
jgi:hypothetical protein